MLSKFAPLLLLAFSASVAAAATPLIQVTGCNVQHATPNLPSGQTMLTVPSGEIVTNIGLGVGVQNYTCASTGTFTSVGALAELLDISCLFGTPVFGNLTTVAFDIFNASPAVTTQDVINALGGDKIVLGQHYFVTNPFTGSGVSPTFDFRAASKKGDPNAFVIANKTGDIPAPTGSQDIDWLELTGAIGDLAKHVFRIDTKAGQPPSTCTPNAFLSVKYTAQYWFYNSTSS
ncbi:hypothetical protein SCHPADRAFT_941911 [Schizopora paradoxa]|uniref:Malate dehydrogenase n=1 Tax=Schizopora paradoxa TaxID=27342 RepID=A0A0H2S3S1_9AGAM|nr:hypothetical protein SCHPADRAFT_941911 [Schizopora paradoxa]